MVFLVYLLTYDRIKFAEFYLHSITNIPKFLKLRIIKKKSSFKIKKKHALVRV